MSPGDPGVGSPPAATPPPPDDARAREEQDRALASDLARRGVAPEEIRRLLSLGATEPPAKGRGRAPATPAPAPIELPPHERFVPKPTIILPSPREVSAADHAAADRLLSQAGLALRRSDFATAEARCREAIELAPGDGAAFELYGDVLQDLGRVDDALAAYERAKESRAPRPSAERKHASLLLMQDRSIAALAFEDAPRNPWLSVLLSALLPGGGQLYNGQAVKALIFVVAALVDVLMIVWSPLGFEHQAKLKASAAALVIIGGLIYIISLIDALRSAGAGSRSGWDV